MEIVHPRRKSRTIFTLLPALIMVLSGLLSGCSENAGPVGHEFTLAPLDKLPAEVKSAPTTVQQSYQFALANPDILQQIPCYCGCGGMGHASNYDCYVDSAGDTGITFDPHALGCSICVDITQDTMRLLKQGKSVGEIRAYVDEGYAKYGPSNMP